MKSRKIGFILLFAFLIIFTNFELISAQEDPSTAVDILISKANEAYLTNDLESVQYYIDEALVIAPDNINVLVGKGKILLEFEKFDEAITFFDKAIEIDPLNSEAVNGKAISLARLEKYEEASDILNALYQENPTFQTLINTSAIYNLWGKYLEAAIVANQVLAIEPDNVLALTHLSIAQANSSYIPYDGQIEILLWDPFGNLAGYYKTTNIEILDNELVNKKYFEEWELKGTITKDDQDFEIREIILSKSYDYSEVIGQFGIEEKTSGLWTVFSHYYGFVARPGDTVDFIFTFNVPVK